MDSEVKAKRNPDPKMAYGERKPSLALIPGSALVEIANAMALGNRKYGPANWRVDPVEALVYANALLRHMEAWIDGETMDPESGANHLGHAAANAIILLDAGFCGSLIDNRPPAGKTGETIRMATLTAGDHNGQG